VRREYSFEKQVIDIFNLIKLEKYQGKPLIIPLYKENKQIAVLKPITKNNLYKNSQNDEIIKLLSQWRKKNQLWYPSVFNVTEDGTRLWLKNQVIAMDDRILFLLESLDGDLTGHMGLFRGEIDNVLRGNQNLVKGGMTIGLKYLIKWCCDDLKIKNLYLRVFSDNFKAIQFYKNSGFYEIDKIPLKKVEDGHIIKWQESYDIDINNAERSFCLMHLNIENYSM
jgi:RimJ/RimL family protein N-acetyltransferase